MTKKTTKTQKIMAILSNIKHGYQKFENHLTGLKKAKRKKYLKLWQHLAMLGDKYEESMADKQAAFKIAFGAGVRFSMRAINLRLREVTEQIRQFVLQEDATESALGELSKAKLHHELDEEKERDDALDRVLEKAPEADRPNRYFAAGQAYRLKYYLGKGNKLKPETQQLLDRAWEASALGFYSESLKDAIEQLTYLRARDEDIPEKLRKKLHHQFALLPEHCPLIEVQVKGIEFYLAPSVERYEAYKAAFVTHIDGLEEEGQYFLDSLINTLIIFPFLKEKAVNEQHFLYKFAIDNGVFLESGSMPFQRFNNVVFILQALGHLDRLRRFVSTHGRLINKESKRENCIRLAECYIDFNDGKYFLALNNLKKVKSLDHRAKIRSYILGFMCIVEYYEKTDAFFWIKDAEDRYKRLLTYYQSTKKITKTDKRRLLNFFNMLVAILNVNNSKAVVLKKLENLNGEVAEINWVRKKLAEIP